MVRMGYETQRQENINDILDMEELLSDSAKLRQWKIDTKEILGIEKDFNIQQLKYKYEKEHIYLSKDELIFRLNMYEELLKFLKESEN